MLQLGRATFWVEFHRKIKGGNWGGAAKPSPAEAVAGPSVGCGGEPPSFGGPSAGIAPPGAAANHRDRRVEG